MSHQWDDPICSCGAAWREAGANLSSAERELERVRASIGKIIDALKDGFAGPELKAEMDELQARKESLLARLATADAQNKKRSPEGDLRCQ